MAHDVLGTAVVDGVLGYGESNGRDGSGSGSGSGDKKQKYSTTSWLAMTHGIKGRRKM